MVDLPTIRMRMTLGDIIHADPKGQGERGQGGFRKNATRPPLMVTLHALERRGYIYQVPDKLPPHGVRWFATAEGKAALATYRETLHDY